MANREDDDAVEPSLDQLREAFAEAMGRSHADTPESDPCGEATVDKSPPDEPLEASADEHSLPSPKAIVEAILFVGHPENQPISDAKIAKLLRGVDVDEVSEIVSELNQEYVASGIPLTIAEMGNGLRLELQDQYDSIRQQFYGRVRRAKLSQMAVDVLAIVAYNQPVTRQKVDELLHHSGGQTSRILNQLVRRELIALQIIDGKPKRREYVTTGRFLSLFGLDDLGDLPRSEDPK